MRVKVNINQAQDEKTEVVLSKKTKKYLNFP